MPHITLSLNGNPEEADASGELNSSGIGFGFFQAWLYLAVFGVASAFGADNGAGSEFLNRIAYIDNTEAGFAQLLFFIASGLCLLFVGITNQRFLRFYVGKNALILATGTCILGTYALFLPGFLSGGIGGLIVAALAGTLMGVGASLLFALWGTAFARYEFATIILNTVAGIVIGVVCYVLVANWIPSPFSGVLTAAMPLFTSLMLWKLTPLPYYKRQEMPIFHPLLVSRSRFLIRFGIPTLIFGIALGTMRAVCMGNIFTSNDITVDLIVGAACALTIVLFIATIALSKNEAHWDKLFRYALPFVGLGLLCFPQQFGDLQYLASFFIAFGYLIFEVLMWVFFADLSQEFRLSPIFVFGIGRGLLELGCIAGMFLVPFGLSRWGAQLGVAELALAVLVCLMIAGALLPRQREIRALITAKINHASNYSNFEDALTSNNHDKSDAAALSLLGSLDESQSEASTNPAMLSATTTDGSPTGFMNLNDIPNGNHINAQYIASNKAIQETDMMPESISENLAATEPRAEVASNVSNIGAKTSDISHSGSKISSTESSSDLTSTSRQMIADPAVEVDTENEFDATPRKGRFYMRCEEIADTYLLSHRETEVLFLLAKGHNAAYIQEKLCVSRSTAKTHINHIYKKMDIHTQQELLNMVEDRRHPIGNEEEGLPDHDTLLEAARQLTEKAAKNPNEPRSKNYRQNIFSKR